MALYGIKDCANLTLFDLATDKPVVYTDYANVTTNEWSAERVYATAKGARSIAWDHDRQSTLAVEMEVFDLKWLAIAAGSEFKTGESNIAKREVVRVPASKKVQLAGSAVVGSIQVVPVGADEIEHIGAPLTEVKGSVVNTGEFSATASEITFATDAVEGTAYAVYYLVMDSQVKSMVISADKFPKAFKVVGDALIREKETGSDEFVQIEFVNARPQSNFTVTMSATEATKLSVTFDLFPNKKKAIAEYKIIGA